MLNHYDLGLYVESWLKSFVISGLPGLWELKYRNLIASVIVFTYVLMIWSVLLQLASEQDLTLNMSFVYLKQKYYENLKFNTKYCQWSYPLCPNKDS